MTTAEPTRPTSRARTYWKWARRTFSVVSLFAALTFLLTSDPVPAAKRAAAERGHAQAAVAVLGFENSNARWVGGATSVHLRSTQAKGVTDIDVVLKRPFWLFGWNV